MSDQQTLQRNFNDILSAWSADVTTWSSVDKCLFLSVLSLLFSAIYWLLCFFLLRTPFLLTPFNPQVIETGLIVLPLVAVGWLTLTLLSYRIRKTSADATLLVYVTVLYYCIPNAVLCYLLGPVTSPLVGIAAIGSMVVAFMLLDFRPAMASVIALLITLIGLTVAERLQWIPYAPLMALEYPVNGRPSTMWIMLYGTTSLLLTVLLVGVFSYLVIRWRKRELLLEQLSYTDALTGITNRRKFIETMELEIERAKRTGSTLSLLMCDADHFKKINDSYGHKVGDQVLKEITKVLEQCSRFSTDLPARVGGEEFAIMLAETGVDEAIIVADRIIQAMRNKTIITSAGPVSVTLSIGVATQSGDLLSFERLLESADQQLYQAKNNGRNRLCYERTPRKTTVQETPQPTELETPQPPFDS